MAEPTTYVRGDLQQKRAYASPKLLSYGNFQTVTLGTIGPKNDGGNRSTKPASG